MDGTGFLKTVRVGGFDKKDVLAYVDELNSKIYALEAELDEKKALLEGSGGGGESGWRKGSGRPAPPLRRRKKCLSAW